MSANGSAKLAAMPKAAKTSGSLSLTTYRYWRRPKKGPAHRSAQIGYSFVVPKRLQPFISETASVYAKVERSGRTWTLTVLILPEPLEGMRDLHWRLDGGRLKVFLPLHVYGRIPYAKWHGGYKAGNAGVLIRATYNQPPHQELDDEREPAWE